MADEIINQDAGASQNQPTIAPEMAEMMAIHLNGGLKPDVQSNEGENGAVADSGSSQQQEPTPFQFQTFTEKFGWAKPEDAEREIQELRTFKATPPVAEIKYENEVSKKLAEAWQAGKTDEVFNYLNQQRQLDRLTAAEVTDDSADEIIKLSMQLKYSEEGLNEREINYKFNKQYALPKEPTLDPEDEESVEKHNAWKESVEDIKMSKIIDGKVAKKELLAAKQNLVLPEIQQSSNDAQIKQQQEFDAMAKLAEETVAEYKGYTPKTVETKINFNDVANKIAFEFQYEPDVESFKKTVEILSDDDLFAKSFNGQDGNLDRKKWFEVIHFGLNREKYLMEAMKQSKNATIKQTILADNSGGGMNRQNTVVGEPSELQKNMQRAGVGV